MYVMANRKFILQDSTEKEAKLFAGFSEVESEVYA